jgi:hypothetical protein
MAETPGRRMTAANMLIISFFNIGLILKFLLPSFVSAYCVAIS